MVFVSLVTKALFGSLKERGRKDFGEERYRRKLRNLSHFLKEYFFRER